MGGGVQFVFLDKERENPITTKSEPTLNADLVARRSGPALLKKTIFCNFSEGSRPPAPLYILAWSAHNYLVLISHVAKKTHLKALAKCVWLMG